MRRPACLLALFAAMSCAVVHADSETGHSDAKSNLYLGVDVTSLALDNDRIPGVPTSSPSHTPKIGSLILGYQDDVWSAEVSFGTDLSDNVNTDVLAINAYRFFGSGKWRPYVSAGFSSFSINSAPDDDTQQFQAGFGVSASLSRNLELRVGYRHYVTVSDESFQDKAIGAALAWHFRKPRVVAASQPEPVPQPEPKEVVETFELQVQFDFDKSVVKSAYEPQFQEIARILEESPDTTMTVEGHTCWIGTEQYNLGLSKRRADAVKEKFVKDYGIDPGRIETEGYGESRPVADNTTLTGRQRNRRAIAVVLRPRIVTE